MFVIQIQKDHFFPANRTLQRVISHRADKKVAPGVEIEKESVFGFVNCFVEFLVNFAVPGIEAVIPGHFEILFRDVLYEKLNKVQRGESCPDKSVIFMPVIVEGDMVTVIGINSGKGDNRPSKIAADIFDDGRWITKIGFGINIKAIGIFTVDKRFCFLKEGPSRSPSLLSRAV